MFTAVFFALCVLTGIPLGMLLKSNRERRIRGNLMPWLPLGSTSLLRTLLGIGIKLLVAAPVFFAPLIFVSEIGQRFALCKQQQLVAFLYLAGIIVGKGLRFAYWYQKDEWS
jgi:hypothetical protein